MASHLFVWAIILGVIAFDVVARPLGWTTVSETLRQIDRDSRGILRWVMLALWAHLFVPFWYTG